MKKGIMIALVLMFVGVSAAYFLMRPPGDIVTVDTGFAEYLPADTIAVISLRNLNDTVDNFPDTATGKFLDKETMTRILTDMGAETVDIQAYNDGHDKVFEVLHNPAFRMIFGDDVDLAVLPVDKALFIADINKALKQSLLILATTNSADIIGIFSTKILKKSVEEFTHGSLVMTRITLEDGSFVFAYTDKNRLLVALEPLVIEKSLKQRGAETVLAKNKNFLDAVKFWEQVPVESVRSRAFIQSDFIRQVLLEAENEEVRQIGQYLSGIHFLASVGGRNQDRWQEESMAAYSYDELDPLIKESVKLTLDSNNETLHMLSVNPLVYSWMADISTSSFLEGMKTDKEQYAAIDAQVKKELGVSLEKLVKSFGPQSGMTLNKIVQTGMFPLPELVFAVQIMDRELVDNALSKVREKMSARGMVVEQTEVNGQIIYSWPILPGETAQPAMILTNNMLYLSNGLFSLQKIIALEKEGKKLPEATGKKLGPDLSAMVKEANSGALLLWPACLSVQLEGVAGWAASMIEASEGVKAGFLKDELLRFVGSSEVIVFTSSLTREHGYGSLVVVDNQEGKTFEK